LKKKISEKDKKDWQDFISNKEKLFDKDYKTIVKKKNFINKIDLHGFSLKNANQAVEELIINSFKNGVKKILVITGKGLRSKNKENPYISENLSILKHSVPEYIKTRKNLVNIIQQIKKADIEDGGEGAFYIYLKKN
tara:strand:+ start:85 stop:495 length:411 start_codon:yes stop_codon:yes gene_type:complete